MLAFGCGLAFVCWLALPATARAGSLGEPGGPVLLTISGAIANTNAPGAARFDRSMLEALGLVTLKTHTNWHDGPATFEGIKFADLLDAVGARGTLIDALALNDYQATIPVSDLTLYTIVLAMKENGMVLTIRDRGPLWIVYAQGASEVGKTAQVQDRMVWQLSRLTIR